MTGSDSTDALRVGDREREQAVAALHDAVGGGYLDLAEFEERSGTVYAARTRGDLRAALADLPTGAHLFAPPAAGPGAVVPGDVDTMVIDWTTVKKNGAWRMPSQLFITGSMGNADLDLRHAQIPLTGCVIEVQASWSTIKIRLGDAVAVRTQDFGGSMTTLKDKAGPPTVPGGPVVEIRGTTGWTTVVLRR